nr:MAG TPA: hypothetical protein [Caudoviricetes sp.]
MRINSTIACPSHHQLQHGRLQRGEPFRLCGRDGRLGLSHGLQLRELFCCHEDFDIIYYQSWRKAPAFRHGDISHTLLPRKEILRGLH